MGRRDEARQVLSLRRTSKREWLPWAAAYAALGDRDEAFRLFIKSGEERDGLNYAKTDPRLDSLHSDPRWQMLLRGMNLAIDADSNATRR